MSNLLECFKKSRMHHKLNWYLFNDILWILLTIFIVIFKATSNSITGDELSTLSIISNNDYTSIIKHSYDYDFNPPFYFILTKFFYNLIPSNLGFRFISLLSFVLSQLLIYSIKGKGKGFLSSIVYLNPLMIYFGSFGRSYMLSILLVILIFKFSRCQPLDRRAGIRQFIVLGSLISIGFWTNYLIGIFVSLLYFFMTFQVKDKKTYISNLLILFAICIPVLIIELQHIYEYTKVLGGIEQEQSSLGVIYKLFYICYGLIFGETLAPTNLSVYVLSFLFLISIAYTMFYFKGRIAKRSLLILSFSSLAIALTSLTDFGRPMYVFYVLPFIPLLIQDLNMSLGRKNFYPIALILSSIYIISNFNYITSNSQYYFSPVSTINYDEIFKEWDSDTSMLIVSPSYNVYNYERFHKSIEKNIYFIDHFNDSVKEAELIKLQSKLIEYDNIIFLHEKPNKFIEDIHDILHTKYILSSAQCKEHKSIISRIEYCYFSINNYNRK